MREHRGHARTCADMREQPSRRRRLLVGEAVQQRAVRAPALPGDRGALAPVDGRARQPEHHHAALEGAGVDAGAAEREVVAQLAGADVPPPGLRVDDERGLGERVAVARVPGGAGAKRRTSVTSTPRGQPAARATSARYSCRGAPTPGSGGSSPSAACRAAWSARLRSRAAMRVPSAQEASDANSSRRAAGVLSQTASYSARRARSIASASVTPARTRRTAMSLRWSWRSPCGTRSRGGMLPTPAGRRSPVTVGGTGGRAPAGSVSQAYTFPDGCTDGGQTT